MTSRTSPLKAWAIAKYLYPIIPGSPETQCKRKNEEGSCGLLCTSIMTIQELWIFFATTISTQRRKGKGPHSSNVKNSFIYTDHPQR